MKGSIMPALSGGMKSPRHLATNSALQQSLTAGINSPTCSRLKLVNQPVLFCRKYFTSFISEQLMDSKHSNGILTGHNLVSCIDELSPQDYLDLSHCTQIATRSADMVSSRFADSAAWLNEYVSTLNFFGWSVFQDAIQTRTRCDVSSSVAEYLVKSAHGMQDSRQGNAMIDTLDALKPDKPALSSLDEESLMGERFQVVPARYDAKGFLEIAVFNLELVANTRKSSFLFWSLEKQAAKIVQSRAFLKLDKRVLETKRALLEKKCRELVMKRFDLRK
ncbi:hypothetical protein K9857_12810 [Pseudomonas sp. REP124]|uniref:hypothetical protein n=1 Tax=Pseudomonas sp. REP124 TaxID=2875731 RepID=UPI001CCE7753|nr:hypothetical protein [Pseudomonas sp. REP124]MBZ9782416.1 hypothetical protein [Pseudomonas sp. REP124]